MPKLAPPSFNGVQLSPDVRRVLEAALRPAAAALNKALVVGDTLQVWDPVQVKGTGVGMGVAFDSNGRLVLPVGLAFPGGGTQDVPASGGGSTPAPLDANTAALWRLDEAAGPWVDLVAGYSFGAESGATAPTVVPGVFGNGLSFASGNAVIATADSAFRGIVGGSWTWEAWFKPASLSVNQTLFALHDTTTDSESIGIYLLSSSLNCQWGVGGGSKPQFSTALTLSVDQWTHLAVICTFLTSTSFRITMIQDARIVGVGTIAAAPPTPTTHNIVIGDGHPTGIEEPLVGVLDDVRVSKVARSSLEIYKTFLTALV